MLNHTFKEIILKNGTHTKVKLAVKFEDPTYRLLGIFLSTELQPFRREILAEIDAVEHGDHEVGEFLGNRCQLVLSEDEAHIYDAIAEDGIGQSCHLKIGELKDLINEWIERREALLNSD